MRSLIGCGIVLVFASFASLTTASFAQAPELPKPAKEHELLKQFVGEWTVTAETVPAPGQEAMRCQGTETAKMVGGFWLVNQGESNMFGTTVNSQMTLGYDPGKKKYIGTFFCSMDSTLWKYEGTMDEAGKKLTLETTGPSPMDPTKTARYRETLELKTPNHKVFTSYMQVEGGDWVKIVTMDSHRKE